MVYKLRLLTCCCMKWHILWVSSCESRLWMTPSWRPLRRGENKRFFPFSLNVAGYWSSFFSGQWTVTCCLQAAGTTAQQSHKCILLALFWLTASLCNIHRHTQAECHFITNSSANIKRLAPSQLSLYYWCPHFMSWIMPDVFFMNWNMFTVSLTRSCVLCVQAACFGWTAQYDNTTTLRRSTVSRVQTQPHPDAHTVKTQQSFYTPTVHNTHLVMQQLPAGCVQVTCLLSLIFSHRASPDKNPAYCSRTHSITGTLLTVDFHLVNKTKRNLTGSLAISSQISCTSKVLFF